MTRLLKSHPALSVVEEFDDPEEIEEAEALKEEDIDVEEGDSQPQCRGRYWFFLLHCLSLFFWVARQCTWPAEPATQVFQRLSGRLRH